MQKCGHRTSLASALFLLFWPTLLSLTQFSSFLSVFFAILCLFPSHMPFHLLTFLFSHLEVSACRFCLSDTFLSLVSFPSLWHCLCLPPPLCLPPALLSCYSSLRSVPASKFSPLGAEAAAEGQLPARGDETWEHSERMPWGGVHLRGGPRSFRERWEDGTADERRHRRLILSLKYWHALRWMITFRLAHFLALRTWFFKDVKNTFFFCGSIVLHRKFKISHLTFDLFILVKKKIREQNHLSHK